jgi:hypothetical protein
MKCPTHDVELIKKRILYGCPIHGKDYRGVILGGCCIDEDSPEYGYQCPVGKEVYYLDPGGNLYAEET